MFVWRLRKEYQLFWPALYFGRYPIRVCEGPGLVFIKPAWGIHLLLQAVIAALNGIEARTMFRKS
jgi:hypothetical protein